jgi:hypothetical protein
MDRARLSKRERQALSQSTAADERLFGFSHELFMHANEHRNVFQAMVGKTSGAVIRQLLHGMLVFKNVRAAVVSGGQATRRRKTASSWRSTTISNSLNSAERDMSARSCKTRWRAR